MVSLYDGRADQGSLVLFNILVETRCFFDGYQGPSHTGKNLACILGRLVAAAVDKIVPVSAEEADREDQKLSGDILGLLRLAVKLKVYFSFRTCRPDIPYSISHSSTGYR